MKRHHAHQFIKINTSFVFSGFREFLEADVKKWHQIRGGLLITTMKLISLAFDVETNRVNGKFTSNIKYSKPGFLETFGYLLSPANCVMGPWVSFNDYLAAFEPSRVKWVRVIVAG